MKLLLTLLAALVLTNAAPVTVTQTVVVSTKYVTTTINGTPILQASQDASTETGNYDSETESADAYETYETYAPETASASAPGAAASSSLDFVSPSTTSLAPSAVAPTPSSAPSTPTTPSTPSTPASTSSTSTGSLNSFEAAILAEHNAKRALHGVSALTWDSTLAEYAANYAASSFSCDNVQLIHSHGPYGENLAAGYTGGAAPVDAWYDEIQYYNWANPDFSEQTGHFTQVVWKGSAKLGCAQVTCDNAWSQYTICEYSPAGNVLGEFAANVLPVLG